MTNKTKALNFFGLVLGFGLGQGALFISQSWLVASRQTKFLGEFGTAFTITILIYQMIDFGGVVILAREALRRRDEGQSQLAAAYWNLSSVRLVIAAAVCLFIFIWSRFESAGFALNYFLWSSLGLLFWAFNPTGIVDGLNLSGVTGATAALPIMGSAMILPLISKLPLEKSGIILGLTYSLLAAATVLLQFLVVKRRGVSLRFSRPSFLAAISISKEGGAYILAWSPGQLFFRAQIAICATIFGTATVGLFVYAKQIINAGNQLLFFARRVEFPRLVTSVAEAGSKFASRSIAVQSWSLYVALAGTVAAIALGSLATFWFPGALRSAGSTVAVFAPTILTGAIFACLTQGCAAMRRLDIAAWTTAAMVVFGGVASVFAAKWLGLTGLALTEMGMQLAGIIVIVRFMDRSGANGESIG